MLSFSENKYVIYYVMLVNYKSKLKIFVLGTNKTNKVDYQRNKKQILNT